MATIRDDEQDRQIRENAERIARNEAAIKRQTEALEQIRDHYYPPPERAWRKVSGFLVKVCCAVFAYLGIAETVDWIWNSRESNAKAELYAEIADRLFREVGDAAGAVNCYDKAIKLDPKESEYVMARTFMKGMALVDGLVDLDRPLTDAEQVRMDGALSEAIALHEAEPENPMPHVLMAQALALSGETDEAVKSVLSAVRLAPERASVRVSACAVLFFAGRLDEARAQLDEALRLDADLPLAQIWKGFLSLTLDHDAAGAVRILEESVRAHPRVPFGHVLLGQAHLAGKRPDLKAARAAFERALVLDGDRKSAMMGLAEIHEREGRLLLSRLWLDKTLVCDTNALPAYVARARIDGKLGAWKTAVSDLTAAIARYPLRAELYRQRSEAYDRTGDAARAEADRRLVREFARDK